MTASDGTASIDIATVIAISVLAYTLGNVVHEGLGHGGATLLLGARPTMFNAIFFNYDESTASRAVQRCLSAAGSIANLLVGMPILAILPRVRSNLCRYFLWLFAAVNVLTAFGYFCFSGIAGIGDWVHVVEGLGPPLLLRGGLTAIGAVLYFVMAPRLLMPGLDPFLGRAPKIHERRARVLSLVPYIAGGIAMVLAGIMNPLGWKLVLISAVAASFGGTSLLAWYPAIPRAPCSVTPEPPLGLERSAGWIVASVAALVVFVFVLGPGVGSLPP